MCKILKLNRSTYYKRLNWKKSNLQKSNEELDEKILEIYYKSKRRYGAPKICKALTKINIKTSLKRVQRRMTVLGIKSVVVKKYKPVKAEKNIKEKENILNQDFVKPCQGLQLC